MHQSKKRKTTHGAGSYADESVVQDAAKPSAVFTPQGGRPHTLSVALPGSIVSNAKSHEQKTFLVGAIARALAVFCVDEIIIFEDDASKAERNNTKANAPDEYTAFTDPSHFLAHVLSYLETPPHLRKYLFPMHPNLRTAGTLPSLDMPHHVRANEWSDYREGVVVPDEGQPTTGGVKQEEKSSKKNKKNKKDKSKQNNQEGEDSSNAPSICVYTGLPDPARIPYLSIPEYTRLTLKFRSQDPSDGADPVAPSAPREDSGYYWGYSVRRCNSLSAVFTECPFDGGYDLSFGMSERGAVLSDVLQQDVPKYGHLLVVFGGVAGIEAAVQADKELHEKGVTPAAADQLFDHWVNMLPGQGSRTIRTEEAVWLGLMGLRGVVEKNDV